MPGFSLSWQSLMLNLQGALVGNIPPALRGIEVNLKVDEEAKIVCYFDGPISEEDEESMQVAYTEILAVFFPDFNVGLETQRLDAPAPLPLLTGNTQRWAYMRTGEMELIRSHLKTASSDLNPL